MKALVIDDERLARKELISLLKDYPKIEIVGEAVNADDAQEKITELKPELLFLGIQMPGRNGFELLESLDVVPKVIFTTAYDEYALKAFKYNSIEYLLKPIDKNELANALGKFKNLNHLPLSGNSINYQLDNVQKSITGDYKKRFLIKIGEQFQNIDTSEVAYIHYQDGGCTLHTKEGRKLPIDYSLEQLEDILNPMDFFRINRQFLVKAEVINEIHTYLNSRLLLKLNPEFETEVIISRDRVSDFKRWMDC